MQTQRESVRCSTSVLEEGWGTWSGTASSAPMGHFSTSSILSVTGGSMLTVHRQRISTVLMMKLLQRGRQPHKEQVWEVMELVDKEEGELVDKEEELNIREGMELHLLLGLITLVLWILPGLQGAFSLQGNMEESDERSQFTVLLL